MRQKDIEIRDRAKETQTERKTKIEKGGERIGARMQRESVC